MAYFNYNMQKSKEMQLCSNVIHPWCLYQQIAQCRRSGCAVKAVSAEQMALSQCTFQGGLLQILGAEGSVTVGVP